MSSKNDLIHDAQIFSRLTQICGNNNVLRKIPESLDTQYAIRNTLHLEISHNPEHKHTGNNPVATLFAPYL